MEKIREKKTKTNKRIEAKSSHASLACVVQKL